MNTVTTKEPSLGEMNQHLTTAGLPTLTQDQAKALVRAGNDRKRVITAIVRAGQHGHENSRAWLATLMGNIGIQVKACRKEPDRVEGEGATARPAAPQAAPTARQEPVRAASQPQPQEARPTAPQPVRAEHRDEPAPAPASESEARGGETATDDPARRPREGAHVYAGNAALCFEPDITRGGFATISVDAAPSIGARKYDWNRKIRIQLSNRELPLLVALFYGFIQYVKCDAHGEGNVKGMTAERQKDASGNVKIFMRVRDSQNLYAVPIDSVDVFRVRRVMFKQHRKIDEKASFQELLYDLKSLGADCPSLQQAPPRDREAAGGGR